MVLIFPVTGVLLVISKALYGYDPTIKLSLTMLWGPGVRSLGVFPEAQHASLLKIDFIYY